MAHVGIEGEAHGAAVREEQVVNRKPVEGLELCGQGVCEGGVVVVVVGVWIGFPARACDISEASSVGQSQGSA